MIDVAYDTNDQGFPVLIWIQMLPKKSQGDVLRFEAAVAGGLIGAALGYYSDGVSGALWGGGIGCGLFIYFFYKSLRAPGQKEWAEKPVVVPSSGQATVQRGPGGQMMFRWQFELPDKSLYWEEVPLASFDVFEVGSMNEWFAGPDDRRAFADCIGLVIHADGIGTKYVAVHAGTKGEFAHLQREMEKTFVSKRAAFAAVGRSAAANSPNQPAPRFSDDTPSSL